MAQGAFTRAEADLRAVTAQLSALATTPVPTVCDLCGQALATAAAQTRHREQEVQRLQDRAAQGKAARSTARNQLRTTQLALETLRARQVTWTTQLELRESEMEGMAEMEAELARLQGEEATTQRLTADEIAKLTARVTDYQQRLAGIQDDLDQWGRYAAMVGDSITTFQELKTYLLAQALPVLNHAGNAALLQLTDGTTRLHFGEDLAFDVLSASGIPYRGRSQGWRRRIDLAGARAIQALVSARHGQALGLAVYDDALNDVDDEGAERILRFIHGVAVETGTVLVAAPDDRHAAYFDHVWRVVKEHGVSRVVTEDGRIP